VIFIDAGAFIARYRVSDDWHDLAVDGWSRLERSSRACYTNNLVVAEALKLIAWYGGQLKAITVGKQILSSSEIRVLRSGSVEELQAIRFMQQFADQNLGFVDGVSMILMRQRRLTTVFGFDKHFELAGFKLWPAERR
jgi:predicted nucleic acid-binding protein